MDMNEKKERIKELIKKLNEASKAYYMDAQEIMPNIEYDAMYDELLALEKETGIIMANSPTQNVGYEIVSDLPKERHPSRMLSLDKTKSREALRDWLGDQQGIMSWKMDGLTIVLTYEGGKLVKALTRGNGDVGEVVTNNAKVFENVPVSIAFKGHLVIRGEAVIKYSDFEKINESLGDAESKYKNARNLCSGSVRQLDPRVTKARHVNLVPFTLVEAVNEDGTPVDFGGYIHNQFNWMADQGFDVVGWKFVDKNNIMDTIEWFAQTIVTNDFPSDGLVLSYDDIEYGKSLGETAKFPRNSIAFKWADQKEETTLRYVEWNASRTGLINPVAVFDPVELEGTTVSRASVHNVSIMRELGLGIGDTINVYKANMIIPQISEDLTPTNSVTVPETCPVCGAKTVLKDEDGVQTLYCPNPDCLAKQIKSFSLFVSRDAMNIDGLSDQTIEKLIGCGIVKEFADLFKFNKYHDEFVEMEGAGEKSFENLKKSIEKARHTRPERLLYAFGIPGIGAANAKLIAKACHYKWDTISHLTKEELMTIDGIGDVLADSFVGYFRDPEKNRIVSDVLDQVELDETEEDVEQFLDGLTFVITGSLHGYDNREQLKAEIERFGGHVSGSVSKQTSYLINNDVTSTSGKNKKAHELEIPIIDEDQMTAWLNAGSRPDDIPAKEE
jgi:DNA ligase (NAD+)